MYNEFLLLRVVRGFDVGAFTRRPILGVGIAALMCFPRASSNRDFLLATLPYVLYLDMSQLESDPTKSSIAELRSWPLLSNLLTPGRWVENHMWIVTLKFSAGLASMGASHWDKQFMVHADSFR